MKIRKSITIKSTDAQGQLHEYHSLDEAPPELRAQIESIQNESAANTVSYRSSAGPIDRIVTERKATVYKIKDASGTEHTYHSLEELPPEIRAAIEQADRDKK
ncbi:MAG TPA: hypothetical protein VHI52_20575 [Verrucomicrobiae bacterium]|nr:hypothetical protein [Verrucomicrobiae bacterium]